MLFTRCPDCRTTFRINVETLHKADGQVRCGRCKSVFNAFERLIDEVPAHDRLMPPEPGQIADEGPEPGLIADEGPEPVQPDTRTSVAQGTGDALGAVPAVGELGVDTLKEPDSSELVIAEQAPPSAPDIGDHEVESLLGSEPPEFGVRWPQLPMNRVSAHPELWRAAFVVGLVALLGQAAHHFRAELATLPYIGRGVQLGYAQLGATIFPAWDPESYEIIEWATSAQASSDQPASLQFSARIANRASVPSAYPLIRLKLTNRWQETIATRFFLPSDYLPADADAGSLMLPGEAANAHLALVDPGPEAYGFEVDVCVPRSAATASCRADRIYR